jgi:hypothetical protein
MNEMNYEKLEKTAYEHFSTITNMGNAHHYVAGEAGFNGKECIMLKMAAEESRKAFNIEFKKRYDLFFYYKANTPK